jgi:hypothetical protein
MMPVQSHPGPTRHLVAIKIIHTLVWAFMVLCILAIPITAIQCRFFLASLFSGIVLIECLVLALNQCRCPLTDVAGRYTVERADNFDIFLPLWLARHNKTIFGLLFTFGEIILLWRWLVVSK